jgi:hypothetical protein
MEITSEQRLFHTHVTIWTGSVQPWAERPRKIVVTRDLHIRCTKPEEFSLYLQRELHYLMTIKLGKASYDS